MRALLILPTLLLVPAAAAFGAGCGRGGDPQRDFHRKPFVALLDATISGFVVDTEVPQATPALSSVSDDGVELQTAGGVADPPASLHLFIHAENGELVAGFGGVFVQPGEGPDDLVAFAWAAETPDLDSGGFTFDEVEVSSKAGPENESVLLTATMRMYGGDGADDRVAVLEGTLVKSLAAE